MAALSCARVSVARGGRGKGLTSLPAFLITIDVEGDNLWARNPRMTCENARFLPRFQALCERFGQRPTYLTSYEMATSPAYVDFARDVLARKTGEVGMHLHAWNSPPIEPLTADDNAHHPYLIDYPDAVMRDKIAFITGLLEDTFGVKMISHRAGRWAMDGRYARLLVEFGYRVDCSVTPMSVGVTCQERPAVGAEATIAISRTVPTGWTSTISAAPATARCSKCR